MLEIYAPDDHQHHCDWSGQWASFGKPRDTGHEREAREADDAQEPVLGVSSIRPCGRKHELNVEGEDGAQVTDVARVDQEAHDGLRAPRVGHEQPQQVLAGEHSRKEGLEGVPHALLQPGLRAVLARDHGLEDHRQDLDQDEHARGHGDDVGEQRAVGVLEEHVQPPAKCLRPGHGIGAAGLRLARGLRRRLLLLGDPAVDLRGRARDRGDHRVALRGVRRLRRRARRQRLLGAGLAGADLAGKPGHPGVRR
mmetsp:Transcript_98631/g.279353  ORF Transcript_98631/g.279353 Transcript_98631/m.279353 type:complete len:252 (+) Transcript_98631:156-911(+)